MREFGRELQAARERPGIAVVHLIVLFFAIAIVCSLGAAPAFALPIKNKQKHKLTKEEKRREKAIRKEMQSPLPRPSRPSRKDSW